MDYQTQQQIISELKALVQDDSALAAYMRYSLGGSIPYACMLTRAESQRLADQGITEDQVTDVAYADDSADWTAGLEYASQHLGTTASILLADALLSQLGTDPEQVFEGLDEPTERGVFMAQLWDA